MVSSLHHVLEPGQDTKAPPLALLHGSEGSEVDLLPPADRIAPGVTRIGIRGDVALGAGFAFFRRHADRRVDEVDLRFRIPPLADLLRDLVADGQLAGPPVVVGYSNGAIMAAALLATVPHLLAGAVLLRPLSPFEDDAGYRPCTTPVLILDGGDDDRRRPGDGRRLVRRLERAGAAVTHRALPAGHAITAEDEDEAREWLRTRCARADHRSGDGESTDWSKIRTNFGQPLPTGDQPHLSSEAGDE